MTGSGDQHLGGVLVPTGDLTVRADPDKLFFIENLIKDIELIPAILDLADNSVDSARQLAVRRAVEAVDKAVEPVADEPELTVSLPEGSFDGLEIELKVSRDEFVIRDNCGGMSLTIAQKYAFRFGRPSDFDGVPGSVGQFGVGMKRALFKLGRWFSVESRTDSEWFDLDVDVDRWIGEQDEQDWTFQFREARTGLPKPDDQARGTKIEVRRLHEIVREDFADDLVINLLREQLRLRHQEALDKGLKMTLNGQLLSGLRPSLMSGPSFKPVRRAMVLATDAGPVTVELIAGIVRSDRKDASVDEGDAENFRSLSEAGWWVFCNDRLLLVADKSAETGWGKGPAAYHPQYRLFRGYVYMSALDPALLPWNTTKTGVDSDSKVWRQVQGEMQTALSEVQGVINRLKKERESVLGDEEEQGGGVDSETIPYTIAFQQAQPTPLRLIARNDSVVVPPIPKPKKRVARQRWQKMQYQVPRDQFDQAMNILHFSSMAELGRRSFDYFYKREVEDQ